MKLMSKRIWPAVSVFIVLLLAALHTTTLVGKGGPAQLTLLIGFTVAIGSAVATFQLWPQSVIAAIENGRMVVGRKSASLADLIQVRVETVAINLVPTNRTYVFHFRNGPPKRLAINVSRVAGGRRAVAAFADQAMALVGTAQAAVVASPPKPRPEAALDFAATTKTTDDGFDPDAIIARYVAAKAQTPVAEQLARPSFGRRAA